MGRTGRHFRDEDNAPRDRTESVRPASRHARPHHDLREEPPTQSHHEQPRQTHLYPHRREQSPLNAIASVVRSPMFAYATGALLISAILFAVTVPTVNLDAQSASGSEATQAKPKPRPKNDEPVEPRKIKHELEGNSADAVRSTNAYGVLTQAIGEFEDTESLVSFAVRDLTTGNELSYDSSRVQYPASSIKAPYTACVYEELIEKGEASVDEVYPIAQEIILDSSDDAYQELRDRYGSEAFEAWLKDADVGYNGYDSYEEMLSHNYSHMCSDQLLRMWVQIYEYLRKDTEAGQQLAGLLSDRSVSALRHAVEPKTKTWGKMGWFDDFGDYESEPATVEGGIVFAEEGPYAVAVMTTAPAQVSDLIPIFKAIARAHYEMI